MGKEPMGKYSRYNNKNVQNVFEKTFKMPILIDIKQRISKRNFYKKDTPAPASRYSEVLLAN